MRHKVKLFYRLADNLPIATKWSSSDSSDDYQMERGYKLGFVSQDVAYVNNHLSITLK